MRCFDSRLGPGASLSTRETSWRETPTSSARSCIVGSRGNRARRPSSGTAAVWHAVRPRRSGPLAWGEALELGDVGGGELVEGVGAEELHGADDLVGEDRDGAVDPGAAAGHEAVEVGAADQGALG